MDDVGLAIAREKLALDMKAARTKREVVCAAINAGTSLEYLSLRHDIPLSQLVYAKSVLELRAAKAAAKEKAK